MNRIAVLLGRKRRVWRSGYTIATLFLLATLVAFSAFPAQIATHDPFAIRPLDRLKPPSAEHLFGTDELGRDVFSRVTYGLRISLGSALLVVVGAASIGTVVGLLAGFYRGLLDTVVMRLADIFVAFPQLVMAMVIVALFGPSLRNAMLAIVVIWWPQYARLVRGQVLTVMNTEYLQAATALGASSLRRLLKHVFPNASGPLLVRASLDVGTALLLTASLSFLGLGASPPLPELGSLVNEGRTYLMTAWWYTTFPGLAILVSVFCLNMLGDIAHDVASPTE